MINLFMVGRVLYRELKIVFTAHHYDPMPTPYTNSVFCGHTGECSLWQGVTK